jgi:uncharacterized protein (DUF58 family)
MSSALSTQHSSLPPWHFNGVVRVTRLGTGFLIFTVVIGFAAINTGNNSLYIALSFMLGALLLSGIASKGGLKHLRVDFESVDEAWAGRPAHGRLRVTNRSRVWNMRDVIVVSDELDVPLLIPLIERRASRSFDAVFRFRRRGIVQLKTVDLYTRYPFGFFLKKRRVKIDGEAVVYPQLLDTAAARERYRAIEGEAFASSRPGPGHDVHTFRDYIRGDSLRHVAWKKSASLGRWIIKQTEAEAGRAMHVVVDPYKPRGVSDEAFEQMISEAATLVFDALGRDLEVVLVIPHVTLRSTRDGSTGMFRALALLQPSHEPVALTVERNSIIFDAGGDRDRKTA